MRDKGLTLIVWWTLLLAACLLWWMAGCGSTPVAPSPASIVAPAVDSPAPAPAPVSLGALAVDGTRFTRGGQPWAWHGWTSFLLFARQLRGDNITDTLDAAVADHVTILRVFGRVPPDNGWPAWADYEHPETRPDFALRLGAFFAGVNQRGICVEYTVLTYPAPVEDERRWLQQAYDVAAEASCAVIEDANEPDVNGIDPVTAMVGVNRHGVLSAYGYGQPPTLDYLTVHTDRTADWWTLAGQAAAFQGLPRVADEPMGADETAQPGRRDSDPAHFVTYAEACQTLGIGFTFHFQDGLTGLPPHGQQAVIAAAIGQVWQ